ncbi:MAG: nucleoside deaminase [Clostridia bacterium]
MDTTFDSVDKKLRYFMSLAMIEAKKAAKKDEIPVGAIIVCGEKVVAKAYNLKEKKQCSNYHAEMVAIRRACKKLRTWRLNGCDIYVTLEPCPMCSGALINARVDNIYFGAYDSKAGCCGTLYNLPTDQRFNHRPNVVGGIMAQECGDLLSEYFKEKRKKKC